MPPFSLSCAVAYFHAISLFTDKSVNNAYFLIPTVGRDFNQITPGSVASQRIR